MADYGILNDDGKRIAIFAAPLTLKSNDPAFVADSMSLKRDIKRRAAQRWELKATVVPMNTDANELFAELAYRGAAIPIVVQVPQNIGVITQRKVVGRGEILCTGSKNSSNLTITRNSGNIVPVGTMVKLMTSDVNNPHTKLYMVRKMFKDDQGIEHLTVYPELRQNVATDTPLIWLDELTMESFMDTDTVQGMVYEDGWLMSPGSLTFIERLR